MFESLRRDFKSFPEFQGSGIHLDLSYQGPIKTHSASKTIGILGGF